MVNILQGGNNIHAKGASAMAQVLKDNSVITYTVLVRREDAATFESREASLEEIMVHLEKEAEEA